jgi:hypothetical protein
MVSARVLTTHAVYLDFLCDKYIHARMHACMRTCVEKISCAHASMHAYVNIYMHTNTCTSTKTTTHPRSRSSVYACIHIHTCIHIRIKKHTQTCMHTFTSAYKLPAHMHPQARHAHKQPTTMAATTLRSSMHESYITMITSCVRGYACIKQRASTKTASIPPSSSTAAWATSSALAT